MCNKKYASYDLHLHSMWSYDATTPVEYYFQRAKELKLRAFAVTDHHNFDAIDEIEEIAKKYSGVGYILGAEMTAKSKFGLFDYVCLGIPSKPKSKLQNLFDRNLAMQLEWGKRFEEVLAEQGFTFTTQERKQLLETYRPARVIAKQGITHVRNEILRNYFLEKGFIKDNDDYEKICSKVYSSNGDYDSLFFLEAKEVIDAVHDSGGIVLIAHPHYYFNGTDEKRMDEILEELPLDGIECAHSNVPKEYTPVYRQYCKKHNLLSSAGTDCHSEPEKSYLNLSPNSDMADHIGDEEYLDEILERVTLYNV